MEVACARSYRQRLSAVVGVTAVGERAQRGRPNRYVRLVRRCAGSYPYSTATPLGSVSDVRRLAAWYPMLVTLAP